MLTWTQSGRLWTVNILPYVHLLAYLTSSWNVLFVIIWTFAFFNSSARDFKTAKHWFGYGVLVHMCEAVRARHQPWSPVCCHQGASESFRVSKGRTETIFTPQITYILLARKISQPQIVYGRFTKFYLITDQNSLLFKHKMWLLHNSLIWKPLVGMGDIMVPVLTDVCIV